MQNFVFRNPTKLIFGKGQLEQLKTEIPQFGKKFFSCMEEAALKEMVFMIM